MTVAIAVACNCDDCIVYHTTEAKKHDADREILVEVVAVTIEMSSCPGTVYAAKVLAAYDSL